MRRLIRWAAAIGLAAILGLGLWLAADSVGHPVSTLMLARRAAGRPIERSWVPLSRISPALTASVILSEDGQFCHHHGVDWTALRDVVYRGHGKPSRGASTLTMQLAKNLFLWPGRSYLRKALEIPLALLLDALWSKKRILEVYLNVAEWGDGVYGAQAAARHGFGTSAADLTQRQAALLAAALPNPVLRRPDKPTRVHQMLAERLVRLAPEAGPHLSCLE